MKKLEYFMQVYMYELENYLKTKREKLLELSFQSDEANTDRSLKEFLKELIENSFFSIPPHTEITTIKFEEEATFNVSQLMDVRITKVFLPEELDHKIKAIIKSRKNAVYTAPDLYLEISCNEKKFYESIELKSTKKDAIPGSSVQQINPNEWVIFIKHSTHNINISTGQYINAINHYMQFPDRSPRPQVSFNEIEKWNYNNRLVKNNSLIYIKDINDKKKYDLINDWQNVLSARWVDMLFCESSPPNNETWFNNNMRKFIIMFLKHYDELDENEQKNFKDKINNLIVE